MQTWAAVLILAGAIVIHAVPSAESECRSLAAAFAREFGADDRERNMYRQCLLARMQAGL